jgi:predicted RNase H-like HicB family nuclease
MPKTSKPRSETARGRRRASSGPALAHGGHPITLDVMVRLQAIALPEADAGFTVVIPALGCATQGDTIEEAQANAVESAEGWLTSQHKRMKDEAIRATQR